MRDYTDFDLAEIADFIDWTPYFASWDLKGRFPAILENSKVGTAASELWADTQNMLAQILAEGWFRPKAVAGFWPANASGDDIILKDGNGEKLATLHTLRQQMVKSSGKPNYALADFIRPEGDDWIGAFCVTAGPQADVRAKAFEVAGDDYSAIMVKALADRFAEAMAELMHQRVRRELWAYASDEDLSGEDLIGEKYRGIRPAPGYPAQPDHTEKETIFRLLEAEARIGVTLTTSFAMHPAPSVSGLYFAHPEAAYFAVGRIERDQVEDYAVRKGWDMRTATRWLAPILNFDP